MGLDETVGSSCHSAWRPCIKNIEVHYLVIVFKVLNSGLKGII